jgi:anaerobic selenocysteine-containing dehydrogenase
LRNHFKTFQIVSDARAKIVGISPDFNSSMVHADLFLAIQPGTDAALALGVAKYIIDQKLYDEPYIKEQTDLPLLVDKRTNRFVRPQGSADNFFFVDAKTGKRRAGSSRLTRSNRSRRPLA